MNMMEQSVFTMKKTCCIAAPDRTELPEVDAATRESLEIVATTGGTRAGSPICTCSTTTCRYNNDSVFPRRHMILYYPRALSAAPCGPRQTGAG